MESDYNNWKRNNLNTIIKNMKKNNQIIQEDFNIESKKNKQFWELIKVEKGDYTFRNVNFTLKGKI